jgi:hypothetical protein
MFKALPSNITGPTLIPFTPWSGLSIVAISESFPASERLNITLREMPPAGIFPIQEPVMVLFPTLSYAASLHGISTVNITVRIESVFFIIF